MNIAEINGHVSFAGSKPFFFFKKKFTKFKQFYCHMPGNSVSSFVVLRFHKIVPVDHQLHCTNKITSWYHINIRSLLLT